VSTGWKKTPNAKPTITITIDEETLKKIEDFQFENRITSRSKALSELIKLGLLELKKEEEGEK
jgi:metal-responsive CopG/Arc/MetJ family transcriptional regulator